MGQIKPLIILLTSIFQLLVFQSFQVKATLNDFPKIGTWEKQVTQVFYVFRPPRDLEKNRITKNMALASAKLLFKEIERFLLPPRKYAVAEEGSKYLGIFAYTVKVPVTLNEAEWEKLNTIADNYDHIFLEATSYNDAPRKPRVQAPVQRRHDQNLESRHSQTSWDHDTDYHHISSETLDSTTTSTSITTSSSRGIHQARNQPNSENLYKRGDEVVEYEGESPLIEQVVIPFDFDMSRLSVPPGLEFKEGSPAWRWKNAGEGVRVYVMDAGCDLRHPEFDDAKVDWLYANPDGLDEPGENPSYSYIYDGFSPGHGTMVVSKILGKRLGLAPKADVTVVKMEKTIFGEDHLGNAVLRAIMALYDHVVDNRPKMKKPCVVVITVGIEISVPPLNPINWYVSKLWVTSLGKLGCYVVVAAGNDEEDTHNLGYISPQMYPELLAGDPEVDLNLVVVGGHDPDGVNKFVYNKFIRISAEATEVLVATPYTPGEEPPDDDWTRQYSFSEGTSFSTPIVAGLLATFISQGYKDPIGYLLAIAKDPLKPGQPKRAFNGIYPDLWPPALRPKGYQPPLVNPRVTGKWPSDWVLKPPPS
ncbi:hypothetical protein TWF506_005538 [Arthrobotrys conoides]|uniref:Peptidase S8/S53 domain-containing protein n=1 Tax=Arthrobotrys conoides TaxID=74498 RepID=A0AAN8RW31_9PEZI